MRLAGQIHACFSSPALESSPHLRPEVQGSATTLPSRALTLLTAGDSRVPLAPKLAPRLFRALQGIAQVALEENGVLQIEGGIQPADFAILDFWPGAADCWKGRAGECEELGMWKRPGCAGHWAGTAPSPAITATGISPSLFYTKCYSAVPDPSPHFCGHFTITDS